MTTLVSDGIQQQWLAFRGGRAQHDTFPVLLLSRATRRRLRNFAGILRRFLLRYTRVTKHIFDLIQKVRHQTPVRTCIFSACALPHICFVVVLIYVCLCSLRKKIPEPLLLPEAPARA